MQEMETLASSEITGHASIEQVIVPIVFGIGVLATHSTQRLHAGILRMLV
jgi:hypothetical protein